MATNNSWNSSDPAEVAKGGSGAATLTGVLTGNGTSAFTVSTVTDNTVIMGSTSNLVQDTTITVTDAGEMVNTSQPAFSALLASSVTSKTGNGATYQLGADALTEIFDQNSDFNTNGTFTAPVTGRYDLKGAVTLTSISAAMTAMNVTINSSNRFYIFALESPGATRDVSNQKGFLINVLADMDAADTAVIEIQISNGTGDDAGVLGNAATFYNGFQGALIC